MRTDKLRLNILGASGHGKVVADIAKLNGFNKIFFYDDNETVKECDGYPVVGTKKDMSQTKGALFIAIGNAKIRKQVMDKYNMRIFPILIHPNAVVADKASLDCGTVVMAGAVINTGTKIGKGVIINTGSTVDHDCKIGNYCHVSVGAHLSGTVTVGDNTWIGAGATISNNIYICGDCMIGAGAVVIRSITESGTYIGVPAKRLQ